MDLKAKADWLKNDLISYVQRLKPTNKPHFGIMSSQHMVEHLGMLLVISTKKNDLGNRISAEQKVASKSKILAPYFVFPKHHPMVDIPQGKLLPLKFNSLEESIEALKKAVVNFFITYSVTPELKINHPLLGELNYSEWLQFHTLHCEHHLKQFGMMGQRSLS